MHFKLGHDDNGRPVPVVDDGDTGVPAVVFTALRGLGTLDLTGAQTALVTDILNAVTSAAYSKGHDAGYAEADASWQKFVDENM